MKTVHILILVAIAAGVGVIIVSGGQTSSYGNFTEAATLAEQGRDKQIHIAGELPKGPQGEPMGIQASPDMLSFSFELVDQEGNRERVYYNEPMPTDFLRSEQVVVVGGYTKQEAFVASKILLKCPSKYEEDNIQLNTSSLN